MGAAMRPFGSENFLKEGECFRDITYEWTTGPNKFLHENHEFTRGIIISTSMLMDFMTITGIMLATVKGESWRVFICFGIFFVLRS